MDCVYDFRQSSDDIFYHCGLSNESVAFNTLRCIKRNGLYDKNITSFVIYNRPNSTDITFSKWRYVLYVVYTKS